MNNRQTHSLDKIQYITEENVKLIVTKYGYANDDTIIDNYTVSYASDKMLGFLADYLKLQISVVSNNERKVIFCFIKAISRTNVAKADMVHEMGLFEKESHFYSVIKSNVETAGLRPWSPRLVARLEDALIFEDLSALQYKLRDRHNKFDKQHILQALQTLARFHSSSIIFEEKKSKELERPYRINDEYEQYLGKGGYTKDSSWFVQCRTGALEAVKAFSKYKNNKDLMNNFDRKWCEVFNSALDLCDTSTEYRNVMCHRDLWNNNILFHYKCPSDKNMEPDDCMLVDFQAVRYMPPAGDVMQLLHCNLDPQFRKDNLNEFLNFYYEELKIILWNNKVNIHDIMTKYNFLMSAEKQNQWGIVAHACLVQTFWLDDDLTAEHFDDSGKFNENMSENKASFIKLVIEKDDSYKQMLMKVFDEIIQEYCLK
ncbi:uncharacterized protein [Choristoneura fumiferana]|uniref:uncharacterized protein n=1 Tax=Choristoneura fumiferana TaxID=7141 RepID=UPI003D15CA0F